MWTGFAMVVISAGLKGIPTEMLEAARVDGATEFQIFWRIILPMLKAVLVVVTVTMIINSLKVFDLVYVMTFGNYDTDVIANRMFKEMFSLRELRPGQRNRGDPASGHRPRDAGQYPPLPKGGSPMSVQRKPTDPVQPAGR